MLLGVPENSKSKQLASGSPWSDLTRRRARSHDLAGFVNAGL